METKIYLFNYSARAFAVAGDTKPIKNILKSAGGRFNPRLSHPTTGQTFGGWIFSLSRQSQVEGLLTGNGIRYQRILPDNINSDTPKKYEALLKSQNM